MPRYIYVRLVETLWIEATDSSVLDWIVNETKKYVPDCTAKLEHYDITGAKMSLVLSRDEWARRRSDDEKRSIEGWLTRLLCENGYEPFAVEGDGASKYFRKMMKR